MNYDNITLTPEQTKLFRKLRAAYKACEKAGIYFVNNYGELEPYNKALVADYSEGLDDSDEDVVAADMVRPVETMRIPVSWADDKHYVRLTRKGLSLIEKED